MVKERRGMTTQSESIFSLATHKNRVFSRSSQPLHPSKYIHVIPFVDPFDTGAPPEVVDIFLEESEGPRSTPFEASTATNTYGHNVLKPLNSNLPSQSIYSFFQEASIFEPSCAHEELAAIIKDAESRERASNRISKNRKPIFEKFKSEGKKCKGDSLNLLQRKAGKNGVTKPRLSKRGTKISDDRKIRDISECFEGMVIEDIDMVKTCKEAHALDRAKQSSEQSELVNMMRLVSLPDKGFEGMVCENNNGVDSESELQMDILIV